jgi:hypothetical protein
VAGDVASANTGSLADRRRVRYLANGEIYTFTPDN